LCFCAKKRRAAYYLTATAIASVFTLGLGGWAWNRAIGTIDTTVTGFWLKHSMTLFTFVKPLASIGGHDFRFGVAANVASQRGFKNYSTHEEAFSTILTDTALKKR